MRWGEDFYMVIWDIVNVDGVMRVLLREVILNL